MTRRTVGRVRRYVGRCLKHFALLVVTWGIGDAGSSGARDGDEEGDKEDDNDDNDYANMLQTLHAVLEEPSHESESEDEDDDGEDGEGMVCDDITIFCLEGDKVSWVGKGRKFSGC